MVFIQFIIYIVAFFILWIGSGFIVRSAEKFSKKLKLSSFAFSFFVLGILTSIPEFAVGMTAVADNNPQVFVGNLIGGIPVIFLCIIPLLAMMGNGVKLTEGMGGKNLLFTFLVVLAPSALVMDRRVTTLEAVIMIGMYLMLFFLIQKHRGILDVKHSNVLSIKSYTYTDILKVLLGVGLVFVGSHFVVENTLYFANYFNVSAFYISLLFLSLGTNLPELTLAIRSVLSGKREVALGDYMGSAAANTFLFGLFTILSFGEVTTVSNFFYTFLIMIFGLGLFYIFTRSKEDISRREGIVLFAVYILFIIAQQFNLL